MKRSVSAPPPRRRPAAVAAMGMVMSVYGIEIWTILGAGPKLNWQGAILAIIWYYAQCKLALLQLDAVSHCDREISGTQSLPVLESRTMFTLLREIGLRRSLYSEMPYLLASLFLAEWLYKFHSFTLECLAFLVTWLVLSAIGSRLARLWSSRPDIPDLEMGDTQRGQGNGSG